MSNINSYSENFIKRFGPKVLKELNGDQLLKEMFGPGSSDSLCYWLERKQDELFDTTVFGSCRGGQPSKFWLYYSNKNSSWMKGTEKITCAEAINVAEKIRDAILKATDFLSKNDFSGFCDFVNNSSFDENTKIYELFKRTYIHKYLHIISPNHISDSHVIVEQHWAYKQEGI